MYIFDESGDPTFILNTIKKFSSNCQNYLVLAGDGNNFTAEQWSELKNIDKTVFGGVYPQIVHGGQSYEQGTILVPFESISSKSILISDLSKKTAEEIEDELEKVDTTGYTSALIFIDGLTTNIEVLIESLFNVFGLDLNYIGGGSGSLSFEQKPCVFHNDGLVMDAAHIVLTNIDLQVGVAHGWSSISEPLEITSSTGNTIETIDHQDAFAVYQHYVEKHSPEKFKDHNFFDIAKGFPFGLQISDSEVIVRDPIALEEEKKLICVGSVPTRSHVQILKGDKDSLLEAAASASSQAFEKSEKADFIFLIDCISRILYLQENFPEELAKIQKGNLPFFGALTLGEIANSGDDRLAFYNKTCVVATGVKK